MSDFENFLCFSSAMARYGGTGSAEEKEQSSAGFRKGPSPETFLFRRERMADLSRLN